MKIKFLHDVTTYVKEHGGFDPTVGEVEWLEGTEQEVHAIKRSPDNPSLWYVWITPTRTMTLVDTDFEAVGLPKFETTVTDLDTESDVNTVFGDFTSQLSRTDLYDAAEWYMQYRVPNSSVYSFRDLGEGLMSLTIGLVLQNVLESEIAKHSMELNKLLMEHYGFTSESMPPRMLLREAVALRVRIGAVLSDLERELNKEHEALVGPGAIPEFHCQGHGFRGRLVWAIADMASRLPNAEEAYSIPQDVINTMIEMVV